MLPQIVLDGLARYERQNSKIRKSTPKRALTQDEKIERLEHKVASLRGILVSSKTAQDALNFRAALCEYRRAVLRGDEWLDGKTQFDFAPIESSEIPAGMKEYAHVCRNTGMIVFEFSDFAKVLLPYEYSEPDWIESPTEPTRWFLTGLISTRLRFMSGIMTNLGMSPHSMIIPFLANGIVA